MRRLLKMFDLSVLLGLLICPSVACCQTSLKRAEVSPAEADRHIVKRVKPIYPPIAEAARLQGKVLLKATISQTGNVVDVKIKMGHPILAPAAVEAVKQWHYRPFIVNGQAAEVSTIIEVPFSLGISETDYEDEQKAADRYFKQEETCRRLLNAHQFEEAQQACQSAQILVEKLPPSRQMERRTAYRNTGQAFFYQKKFGEALSQYRRELSIAEASLKPYDAELGYAFHDVALGLHGTGDLQQARSYYERAETTLERARKHIESPFLKNQYSRSIKSVWMDYAVLLRQSGDISGANAAEQKANSIAVRTDLKDQ